MIDLYADDNISWEDPWEAFEGAEPWEPDDDYEPQSAGGCAYCPETEVRESPEPFGGQPCCEGCFNVLIGGERDDRPWRCGNDQRLHPSMVCARCGSRNVTSRDHDGHGAAVHIDPANNGRWSASCENCQHRWSGKDEAVDE